MSRRNGAPWGFGSPTVRRGVCPGVLGGAGGEAQRSRLNVDPPAWLLRTSEKISRRIFLGWLKESTDSRERVRDADSNHFYGKVHLLIYAQMTGQTWSHLILTGLNEGVW